MAVKSTPRRGRGRSGGSRRRGPGRPPAGDKAPAAREAILDAAARLIAERGYAGASVSAILEQAGLSKGAFYWHFPTKDDLIAALLTERVERPVNKLIELLRTAPPEQNMSAEATRRFAEFLQSEPEAVLLEHEFEGLAARDPRLRRSLTRRRRELRDALAEALRARSRQLGAPPLDTPAEEVATAYLALIRGLARDRLLDPKAVPAHLVGDMAGLIYIGLLARAQGGPWEQNAVLD